MAETAACDGEGLTRTVKPDAASRVDSGFGTAAVCRCSAGRPAGWLALGERYTLDTDVDVSPDLVRDPVDGEGLDSQE